MAKFKQTKGMNKNKKEIKKAFYRNYTKTTNKKKSQLLIKYKQFKECFEDKSMDKIYDLLKYDKFRKDVKAICDDFMNELKVGFYIRWVEMIKGNLDRFENIDDNQLSSGLIEKIRIPPLPTSLLPHLAKFYDKFGHYLN